jgi:hypothetical protein
MRLDPAHLEHARKVADAILYEGYLLYPYRRSAAKNQVRFQFGVLMPPGYQELDDSEPSASQTECLLECPDDAEILVVLRFLQLQRRTVQAVSPDDGHLREVSSLYLDGTEYTSWGRGRRARASTSPSRPAACSRRTGTPSSTPAGASQKSP